AGTIEDGESPRQTAERELLEEAGAIAKRWTELGEIFTSPGVFRERMFLFLAEDLTLTNTEHETEEVISVHWKPVDEVLAWTDGGEIKDAKTLIAINYWRSNHQIE
ncbi:MAG: NUDIX hydrolase, partial [Pseudomonadota bacterium]